MKKFIKITIIIVILAIVCVLGALTLKKLYRINKDNTRKAECEIIPEIVCIGDSLTQGTDGTYPKYLEELMVNDAYYIPVYNTGIGGEDTTTISGRMGGVPFKIEPFDMPEDGEMVPITIIKDEIHDIRLLRTEGRNMVNPVVIAGVSGELSYDSDTFQYYFTRIDDATDLTESQKINIETYDAQKEQLEHEQGYYEVETYGKSAVNNGIYIIFMGENGGFENIDELIMQQRAILANQTLNSDKYLIIGMTTGTNEERQELEGAMVAEYGDKYINLRAYFSGETDEVIEDAKKYDVAFTDEDIEQMSEGMVPECLRGDSIHYNNAGYRLLADLVYERMNTLGYFDEVEVIANKYERVWGLANKLEILANSMK